MSVNVEQELAKMRYHIKQLKSAIDFERSPLAGIIVELDLDEHQVDQIYTVFQEADDLLEAGKSVSWNGFEHDIKARAGIGYQHLKLVVLALYCQGQFTDVCRGYATAKECSEFKSITRPRAR